MGKKGRSRRKGKGEGRKGRMWLNDWKEGEGAMQVSSAHVHTGQRTREGGKEERGEKAWRNDMPYKHFVRKPHLCSGVRLRADHKHSTARAPRIIIISNRLGDTHKEADTDDLSMHTSNQTKACPCRVSSKNRSQKRYGEFCTAYQSKDARRPGSKRMS